MRMVHKIERIPSTEGVVLYLPLDKAYMRGALVQDQSQEQNHGTAVNSPVPSQPGFLFNGSDQHIDCGQDSSLDITTLSITAWVKLGAGFALGYIVSKGTLGTPLFSFGIASDNKVGVNGESNDLVAGDTVLTEGQWHFVGASLNGTDAIIYVNDEAGEAETITAPASSAALNLLIGARNAANEVTFLNYFDGHIADVRIYNRVLTDNQFLAHYNIQRGKYGV